MGLGAMAARWAVQTRRAMQSPGYQVEAPAWRVRVSGGPEGLAPGSRIVYDPAVALGAMAARWAMQGRAMQSPGYQVEAPAGLARAPPQPGGPCTW
jgi:hypothetical protein